MNKLVVLCWLLLFVGIVIGFLGVSTLAADVDLPGTDYNDGSNNEKNSAEPVSAESRSSSSSAAGSEGGGSSNGGGGGSKSKQKSLEIDKSSSDLSNNEKRGIGIAGGEQCVPVPFGCDGAGVAIGLEMITGDGESADGRVVVPGQELLFQVTLFQPGETSCSYHLGQLVSIDPDGNIAHLAGYEDTSFPVIPIVGYNEPFTVTGGSYFVDPADSCFGEINAFFAVYGSSAEINQENGVILSCPQIPKATAMTGLTTPTLILEETCYADADYNGKVDEDDLDLVIDSWGEETCRPENVNKDDRVDVQDLVDVILNWGECGKY